MGVGVRLRVENSRMVYAVYPDLAIGMYHIIVLHDNPYVVYKPVIIVEKGQIARFTFFNKA